MIIYDNNPKQMSDLSIGTRQGVAMPDRLGDPPHGDARDAAMHTAVTTQRRQPDVQGGGAGGARGR